MEGEAVTQEWKDVASTIFLESTREGHSCVTETSIENVWRAIVIQSDEP